MKNNEFKEMSISELESKERELRNELEMLNLKKNVSQVTQHHKFSEIRKNIARILTAKNSVRQQ